jgi:hypothetical protein
MKHKTAELEGALLDAAVALAVGYEFEVLTIGTVNPRAECQAVLPGEDGQEYWTRFEPSQSWGVGGPIIERNDWCLPRVYHQSQAYRLGRYVAETLGGFTYFGPTPLIAAMRAFVASKLGEEVELP